MQVIRFISLPTPDLPTISQITHGVLGRSSTEKAQNSQTRIPAPVQMAICLADMLGEEPLVHPVLQHLSMTALFVFPNEYMVDVVNKCGMLVSFVETNSRTHAMGIMTGTLSQWRDACIVGEADPRTKTFFTDAKNQLLGLNIDLWRPNNQLRLR